MMMEDIQWRSINRCDILVFEYAEQYEKNTNHYVCGVVAAAVFGASRAVSV
jgi:hypothetical protein